MILSVIVCLVFLGTVVGCLVECFDTEEYDQQTCSVRSSAGCDTRDNRI